MRDVGINHNRVIMPASSMGRPVARRHEQRLLTKTYMHNIYFHDNVFKASGGVPLAYLDPGLAPGSTDSQFKSNWYLSDRGLITWNSRSFSSLAEFRAGTVRNSNRQLPYQWKRICRGVATRITPIMPVPDRHRSRIQQNLGNLSLI